jgi:stress-induced morphogen
LLCIDLYRLWGRIELSSLLYMEENSSCNVIKTALPPSFFQHHIGAYDDPNGSHVSIEVTSALFEGKRPVQRQQLVYKALWEGMSLHNGRLF